jgi:methylmalonyl-CoA/ethylmalonyl-CoA epimerase
MNFNKIDHVGIAVSNLNEIKEIYENTLGLERHFEERVDEQKVSTIGYELNGTNIEFLEPTAEDSPIAKYIAKKGHGIHHIAYQVDNLDETLEELKAKNVRLIDEKPRIGAEGKRIAFVHPKAMGGILVELSEKK